MVMRKAFHNSKCPEEFNGLHHIRRGLIEEPKVDAFIEAIRSLQREHGLQINVDNTGEAYVEKYDEHSLRLLDEAYIVGDVE
jgi:hypothetical protein